MDYIFFTLPIPACSKGKCHKWSMTQELANGDKIRFCIKCQVAIHTILPEGDE